MAVVVAAFLSALLTRWQASIARPQAPRADRWNAAATPSSAGIAIFLSCAAAYVLSAARYPRIAWAVAELCVFGWIDDRLRLPAGVKLAAQFSAAGFVVAGGVVFPLTPSMPMNAALAVFWIVVITNAFNLIDNMDGLCAGVVIIICLFRAWVLLIEGYRADAELYGLLGAAFAGFLFSNYPPARIFMGDCGSLPAGFALGSLTLAGPAAEFPYAATTFSYPIFDVLLVFTLRTLGGQPFWQGGCDHSSHRLASAGLAPRQAVWSLWVLTACGGSLGVLVHWIPEALLSAAGSLVILLGVFGVFLGRVAVQARD